MMYPDLLILRHGETEWNRMGRMQGAEDSPLTGLGRAQAETQGRLLAKRDLAGWSYCISPQGRCRETARIALGTRVGTAKEDSRLVEITLGDWTGKLRTEIAAEVPHLFDQADGMDWYDHAPGGEGLEGIYARTGAFLAELNRPTVVVTHGITSRMLRCHYLGLEPAAFDTLPGGQGVIYHMSNGNQACFAEGG
ncbi:phosphoglycerate mutase [Tateyamaria omphalii]|uniref:histidine phosphatase family protein n=1 Tax=Tateyamaria omphalii TaxID=299262 RepID=UPI001677C836|nr:histidine phosphatase family protein [Tateyamaria omphalii]GGX47036.1 phosphoglycerate mutase [Tateyamaria omphalii]